MSGLAPGWPQLRSGLLLHTLQLTVPKYNPKISICALPAIPEGLKGHEGGVRSQREEKMPFVFMRDSTGSLASQRHPGKLPKVPGRRRGTRGFPAAPRQRPRECRRLRGRGCANCQSLPQPEPFVRQRERPGLHSQAVAWPPRLSAPSRARASSCQAVGTTWFFSSCGGILELRRGSQPSPWVGHTF